MIKTSKEIRIVKDSDLDAVVKIEQNCFPHNEAATKSQIKDRITSYGAHFFLLEIDNVIIGFINGMVSDNETIRDEMYENANLHNEMGQWQMVFGLDVIEAHRKNGYASLLMKEMIEHAFNQKRKGVALTCKKNLISFYEKLGFECTGQSQSIHGGVVWYDMKLTF